MVAFLHLNQQPHRKVVKNMPQEPLRGLNPTENTGSSDHSAGLTCRDSD